MGVTVLEKKFQVFLSSTYRDLMDERLAITRSILDLGHIPSGMELFPAADEEQFGYIKKVIEECDYYVLLIAGRYGSVASDGLSYTEKEYQFAVERGKTVLAFIHENPDALARNMTEDDPQNRQKLQEFVSRVSSGRLVQFWNGGKDLELKVTKSLIKAFTERPGVGWIRANVAASEDLLRQINKVTQEQEILRVENENLKAALSKELLSRTPMIDNLAGLADELKIHFKTYRLFNGRRDYTQRDITITWGKLFSFLGPQLMNPTGSTALGTLISSFVKENRSTDSTPEISQSDVNLIKIHFEALKYWRVYSAESLKGGLTEFVQVTDLGRRVLMETLAARKIPNNS